MVIAGAKADGNAWERHSQACHFCNLVFPGLKERFSVGIRTFLGRNCFIHGNARSWAAIF